MSVDITGNVNNIRISAIHSDPKLGTWWAFATDKQWVGIRTTKAGKIRVFEIEKGQHPYFTAATPTKENLSQEEEKE